MSIIRVKWRRRLLLVLFVLPFVFTATSCTPPPTLIKFATHNVETEDYLAMNHIVYYSSTSLRSVALQEVCENDYIGSGQPLWNTLANKGYEIRAIRVTHTASSACDPGVYLLNVIASWGFQSETSGWYTFQAGTLAPNERRGYICSRSNFGKYWIACSTHMEFRQNGTISVLQQTQLRAAMDQESNWAIKVMMGDYNVRPGNLPNIGMQFNASENYNSYREADEVATNGGFYNSTRNPPGSYPNQKIDYIFVGRFWTSNANGYQELSCTTTSDHCVVIGDFYAN